MANVNGRQYSVEAKDMSGLDHLVTHLKAKGFDGVCYYLTGKRGAVKMAYRTLDGQYVVAC